MSFGERLDALVETRRSQVVLGLDPDPANLWPGVIARVPEDDMPVRRAAMAVAAHCRALIDAAGPSCVGVKPQLACFERLGADGWAVLSSIVKYARAEGLFVLADGKRGDISVSAAAYAQALLNTKTETHFGDIQGLGADAFTANPYLGKDALEPFVTAARAASAGVFVLVRTSNPGARDVQDLELAGGATVWERVAEMVAGMGDASNAGGLADVGAVVGATRPEHIARMRELMPRTPFLLPGIGAQGGQVESLAPAFAAGRAGGLVTASRSIAHAYEKTGEQPAAAARAEAERLRRSAWALS